MKENLPAIFMPIALIIAGTISPSNGVDEGYYKSPFELISIAFIIMFVGIITYIVFKYVKFSKLSKNVSDRKNQKNPSYTEATNF